jgi:putative transposase
MSALLHHLLSRITLHLREQVKPRRLGLLANAAVDLTRSPAELLIENALLRQQLIVLHRQIKHPRLKSCDRVLMVVLASWLTRWRQALLIVQPDTLLRWHRDLFRWLWRRKSRPRKAVGRHPLSADQVVLIRQMAQENRTWGIERIRGELLKLGIRAARSTLQKYLRMVRKPTNPQQTWQTFVHNHARQIWACDFLQTYDLFFRDLFVFVLIELGSRRVVHWAVTRHPSDDWVAQQLREATPFGQGPRLLLRDRDSKYGASFARVATGAGTQVLLTPFQAPKANAICERFLGSLRRECLDFFLLLGERHLIRVVRQYVEYFNQARPHQGVGQRIPCPREPVSEQGEVIALPVLGGLHHDYQRRAA